MSSLIKYQLIVTNEYYYQEDVDVKKYRKAIRLLKIDEYAKENKPHHLSLRQEKQNQDTLKINTNKLKINQQCKTNLPNMSTSKPSFCETVQKNNEKWMKVKNNKI